MKFKPKESRREIRFRFPYPQFLQEIGGMTAVLLLFTLTGCSGNAQTNPAALPTVVLGGNNTAANVSATASPQARTDSVATGGATASGNVVPAEQLHMAFTL